MVHAPLCLNGQGCPETPKEKRLGLGSIARRLPMEVHHAMNYVAATPAAVDDREHRRNALVLAVAAAVGGGIPTVLFAIGGLAGMYLLGPDKSLATLPLSAFTVGVA